MGDEVKTTIRLPEELHARLVAQVEAKLFPSFNSAVIFHCWRSLRSEATVNVTVLRALGVPEETIEAAIRAQRSA